MRRVDESISAFAADETFAPGRGPGYGIRCPQSMQHGRVVALAHQDIPGNEASVRVARAPPGDGRSANRLRAFFSSSRRVECGVRHEGGVRALAEPAVGCASAARRRPDAVLSVPLRAAETAQYG